MAESSFRQLLTDALRDALVVLKRAIKNEDLYAFAVCTDSEANFEYLTLAANTEEGLQARVREWSSTQPEVDTATLARELRWSMQDWTYRNFYEPIGDLVLPAADGERRDAKVYSDIVAAMKTLDDDGSFGDAEVRSRITLLILCPDASPDVFQKGLRKLNPVSVVKAYLSNYTPALLYARLDAMAPEQRLATYLRLYEDLALNRDTLETREARQCNLVSHLMLGAQILKLGPSAIDGLLAIIERYVAARAFNEEGTAAWKRDGAMTVESNLAISTVQLLGACDSLSDRAIERLQSLLVRRLEVDADTSGPVSTLPEAIARVLYEVCPERFPPPQKSRSTSRLSNAKAYH